MKKFIFSMLALGYIANGFAQTSNSSIKTANAFESAMLTNIRQLDTASSAASLITLANNFERIGKAEKIKWEPFYYAAYCYTAIAFMSPDKSAIDQLADRAESILQEAEILQKNNSEISCLFAMINSCRILVDPAGRFMIKGKEVNALLAKAMQEDVNNPRIYLLQARMQLRTPEAFGGGKQVAKASAEIAVQEFSEFKVANSIAPSWGQQQAIALLNKINAQ
ncbi:MAG TPA: hypothetical protein VGD17_15980 [Chitinophagaceae bacterium]